ncbi:fumarate/nitrate reduction transcriptional regulator Fnr [Marinobacteraceae bacterium S3BR75-40.1]
MGQRIPAHLNGVLNPSCNHCSLSNLCLPIAVSAEEITRLEEVVDQGASYDRGAHVFHQHEPFKSCYAVRSGAIKTYIETSSGEEQVTGFYLPGEIVGLDSINTSQHSCSAKALERTTVCEIPIQKLENLSTQIPSLQHHFFQLMSQEIQNSQHLSMLLSKKTAEERLASLLLSLSSRFKRRKLSPTQIHLPMARNDIANFLGLAVETVSRVLTRFQKQGLIKLQGRDIDLLDVESLLDVIDHRTNCR